MGSSETFEAIYSAAKRIPNGKVTNYGMIGKFVGVNPRVVGYALHSNPREGTVPCHRVVFKDGSLAQGFAFGGIFAQRDMLEKEGIIFKNDKVISECFWIMA